MEYTMELQRSNVCIKERVDELRWVYSRSGIYIPKFGYNLQMDRRVGEIRHWWFKPLWKLSCPVKSRLFFWCILRNKVPTWDYLQKRNKHGPCWCSLYKIFEESSSHVFLTYPFSIRTWEIFLNTVRTSSHWFGVSLEDAWKNWWSCSSDTHYRNIPLIICWGIWLAKKEASLWINLQVPILFLFNMILSMN